MKIFIASDHRGFNLKNQLINVLKNKYELIDLGNSTFNTEDDYPDFAFKLSTEIINNLESLGIIICGSGVGVCIATNRIKNIRCGLGFNLEQIKHARENDHINVLALASDYINLDTAIEYINIFTTSKPKIEEKYLRRIKKLDNIV